MKRRPTVEELHEEYGFKLPEIKEYIKRGEHIHPVHKKHREISWLIFDVYGHVEAGNISQDKARELTSSIIEKYINNEKINQ